MFEAKVCGDDVTISSDGTLVGLMANIAMVVSAAYRSLSDEQKAVFKGRFTAAIADPDSIVWKDPKFEVIVEDKHDQ